MKGRRLKISLSTNNKKILIIAAVVIILSFISIYAGHFLFERNVPPENNSNVNPGSTTAAPVSPVTWKHLTADVDGYKQEINILEVDVADPGVKIMPVLSHDIIYGFENLSAMVSRRKAFAAVNGGFFSVYGLPSGMVAENGVLFTGSTGKYPVLSISEGKASLSIVKSQFFLDYGTGRLKIGRLNSPAGKGGTAAYTSVYGSTDRISGENITVTVKNNIITDIGAYQGEADIPDNGMLAVFCDPSEYNAGNLPFRKGDTLRLVHEPLPATGIQAYECGTWLVRDGKVVVGEKDPWTGVLTNHDPRTAVGIRKDGRVLLLTVDGRQPGYSAGMTGRELGDYLVSLGVVDAAMLDGGASTEMIVDGRVVNRPSFKGQERPLGGGLLVFKNQK